MCVVTGGSSLVHCVPMEKNSDTIFQMERAAAPGYLTACESLARGPHSQMARFTDDRSIMT